jgi:hypothetical protein
VLCRTGGGTSVGAIAASLVAAAEYNRQRHGHAAVWSDSLDAALDADLAGAPVAQPGLPTTGYGALYGIPAERRVWTCGRPRTRP